MEPRGSHPAPRSDLDRNAADHAAALLGRRRVDSARPADLRVGCAIRDRPPHGRPQRLLPRRGRRDRQGDSALPRARERLERHRLQLSRRPLRDDLRGPLRRHRSERRGRARTGVQHGLRRNRAPRDIRRRQAVCGSTGRDRAAHRVAARSRTRRSHLVPHLHLRRKRAVRERHSRAAERGLGSP